MSVSTVFSALTGKIRRFHRRASSEPADLPSYSGRDNTVRFDRSRSLVYLNDLPFYKPIEMASATYLELANNGTVPEKVGMNDMTPTVMWLTSDRDVGKWKKQELRPAEYAFKSMVADEENMATKWAKYTAYKSSKERIDTILWKVDRTPGMQLNTLLAIPVYARMRDLHKIREPNQIKWHTEADKMTSDEVFDRNQETTHHEENQEEDAEKEAEEDAVVDTGEDDEDEEEGEDERENEGEPSVNTRGVGVSTRRGRIATNDEKLQKQTEIINKLQLKNKSLEKEAKVAKTQKKEMDELKRKYKEAIEKLSSEKQITSESVQEIVEEQSQKQEAQAKLRESEKNLKAIKEHVQHQGNVLHNLKAELQESRERENHSQEALQHQTLLAQETNNDLLNLERQKENISSSMNKVEEKMLRIEKENEQAAKEKETLLEKNEELQQEIDNLRANEKNLLEAQTITIRSVTEQNDLLKLQLNTLGTQIKDRDQKLSEHQSVMEDQIKESEEERKLIEERLHEEIVKVRNSRDAIKDLKQIVQNCTCKEYNEEEDYNADYEENPPVQYGPVNELNRDPVDNEGAAAAIAGNQRPAEQQYATREEVQRMIVQHTSPVPDTAAQDQPGASQLTQLTAVITEHANNQLKEVVTPLMENFTEFTKKMFDQQNGIDPATAKYDKFLIFSGTKNTISLPEFFSRLEEKFNGTWTDQAKVHFAGKHLDAREEKLKSLIATPYNTYQRFKEVMKTIFGDDQKEFEISDWEEAVRFKGTKFVDWLKTNNGVHLLNNTGERWAEGKITNGERTIIMNKLTQMVPRKPLGQYLKRNQSWKHDQLKIITFDSLVDEICSSEINEDESWKTFDENLTERSWRNEKYFALNTLSVKSVGADNQNQGVIPKAFYRGRGRNQYFSNPRGGAQQSHTNQSYGQTPVNQSQIVVPSPNQGTGQPRGGQYQGYNNQNRGNGRGRGYYQQQQNQNQENNQGRNPHNPSRKQQRALDWRNSDSNRNARGNFNQNTDSNNGNQNRQPFIPREVEEMRIEVVEDHMITESVAAVHNE